jgi:hypothetical protein
LPSITTHPSSVTVSVGQSATFTVAATGAAPLSYQWQRNGVNISGATAASYTRSNAQLADSGSQFRCVVSNAAGSATSNAATLTVLGNAAPAPTILTPAETALYSGGQTIAFTGSATDAEDGNLAASAFTWEVVFHHDTHTHPAVGPITGTTAGSFTVPTTGETSSNVWYRVHLTVRDSTGQTSSVFRDVRPRTVQVTLATSPSGLSLTLDGQNVVAPYTFTGVVGIQRTLGAQSTQTTRGKAHDFVSWSDGGSQTHTISTPSAATTYTATYLRRKGR